MKLCGKDIKKLENIEKYVKEGTANTLHKKEVLKALETILRPKCAVCRKPVGDDLLIVNGRKLHSKCSTRYKAANK